MASASFSSVALPTLQPISEKLMRSNFLIWKALVLSALKGAQISEFLFGTTEAPAEYLAGDDKKKKMPNLEFAGYIARQQQVLNFLLSSLSKKMLKYVATYTTPQEVWGNLVAMTSQSHARVVNTCMVLSTTRKGNLTVSQYVGKMKLLAGYMVAAGKKLDDEDLVSYILAGLDSDFDSVISAVTARAEPITELYSQLIGYEQRQELRGKDYSMANAASRGGGFSRGQGRSHGRGNNNSFNGGEFNGSTNLVECQLCGKKGHHLEVFQTL
jgi:hypothetical protein